MLNIARTLKGFALAAVLLVPSLGLAAKDQITRRTANRLASEVVTATHGRPVSSDGYSIKGRVGSNQHVLKFRANPYWRGPVPMTMGFVAIPSRLGSVKLDKTPGGPTGHARVTLESPVSPF